MEHKEHSVESSEQYELGANNMTPIPRGMPSFDHRRLEAVKKSDVATGVSQAVLSLSNKSKKEVSQMNETVRESAMKAKYSQNGSSATPQDQHLFNAKLK